MGIENVNNQNLQAIYENLTQLSKELNGEKTNAEETLFDQTNETDGLDNFVSTTEKTEENTAENETAGIFSGW